MAFKDEYKNAYVTPERPYKEDDPWAHGDVNNIIAGIEECKVEKLDKITGNSADIRVYAVSKKGIQSFLLASSKNGISSIAMRGDNNEIEVGTPTEDAHAANKKYVDEQVASSGSADLSDYVRFDSVPSNTQAGPVKIHAGGFTRDFSRWAIYKDKPCGRKSHQYKRR